jgi:hypothetical protein
MPDRTVFVLGAGFSAPAKLPVQADIMKEVMLRRSQSFQIEAQEALKTMFESLQPDELETVPLEDVFTMLDRARKAGETIKGFSHEEIRKSYAALVRTIVHEFQRKLNGFDFSGSPFVDFADELIAKRYADGSLIAQDADPFSLISLNWDTIPDYLINTRGCTSGRRVVLDYGCYDYDLEDSPGHLPSIRRKGQGLFNVKLLKLHGSLNWVVCSCCARLFSCNTGGSPPIASLAGQCRYCGAVDLENVIITPTLMKDLAQNQVRNVWHNAYLDLQDCSRLVFVGYSFPMADFEFRYMLLKATLGNQFLKVRVVLFPPDPCTGEVLWRRNEVQNRYQQFFGANRDIEFKFMDSADFMRDPRLIWDW